MIWKVNGSNVSPANAPIPILPKFRSVVPPYTRIESVARADPESRATHEVTVGVTLARAHFRISVKTTRYAG